MLPNFNLKYCHTLSLQAFPKEKQNKKQQPKDQLILQIMELIHNIEPIEKIYVKHEKWPMTLHRATFLYGQLTILMPYSHPAEMSNIISNCMQIQLLIFKYYYTQRYIYYTATCFFGVKNKQLWYFPAWTVLTKPFKFHDWLACACLLDLTWLD